MASIVIGVTAFGERLRPGPGFVTLDELAITVMCAGVAVLIRSPLVAGLSGTPSDEYLSADPVLGTPKERAEFSRTERGGTDPARASNAPGPRPRTSGLTLPGGESQGG